MTAGPKRALSETTVNTVKNPHDAKIARGAHDTGKENEMSYASLEEVQSKSVAKDKRQPRAYDALNVEEQYEDDTKTRLFLEERIKSFEEISAKQLEDDDMASWLRSRAVIAELLNRYARNNDVNWEKEDEFLIMDVARLRGLNAGSSIEDQKSALALENKDNHASNPHYINSKVHDCLIQSPAARRALFPMDLGGTDTSENLKNRVETSDNHLLVAIAELHEMIANMLARGEELDLNVIGARLLDARLPGTLKLGGQSAYMRLHVTELRETLRLSGLRTSGVKSALVNRLCDGDESRDLRQNVRTGTSQGSEDDFGKPDVPESATCEQRARVLHAHAKDFEVDWHNESDNVVEKAAGIRGCAPASVDELRRKLHNGDKRAHHYNERFQYNQIMQTLGGSAADQAIGILYNCNTARMWEVEERLSLDLPPSEDPRLHAAVLCAKSRLHEIVIKMEAADEQLKPAHMGARLLNVNIPWELQAGRNGQYDLLPIDELEELLRLRRLKLGGSKDEMVQQLHGFDDECKKEEK